MLQFSQFVWALRSSVWEVFNNFLLLGATDRSKIRSDQKRFLSHLAYTPFHFSRTLPLRQNKIIGKRNFCERIYWKKLANTPFKDFHNPWKIGVSFG